MIHRISLKHVAVAAKHRPAGYFDDIVSRGRLENGVLFVEANVYDALRQKYATTTKPLVTPRPSRPGDLFAIIIRKITGAKPCPNKCRERIAQMNEWGWLKCLRNRKTIATWLAEEARRRGHQISENSALDLFKAALRELRQHRPGKPSAQPLQSP